jgi:nucleoporin NUP82
LPDYRLSMKWEDFFTDSSSVSAVSVLTVLDHAKPKSQGQTTINVLEKSSLLMENDSNLYKVNLSPEGKSVSSTELLLKNFQDYEGHGVIYDYEKNTRYQIILSNSKLDVQKEAIDTSKHLKKDDDKVDVEIPYHSVLNLSITSELLILLDKIKNFKIYLPPNLSVLSKLDEDSLSELNSITNSISKNLLNFHKSGIIVNYKLNNLSAEFQNQITVTSEIFEKYRKLSGINNSLEKVIERQESLNKRFDSLKKNIHTSSKSFDLTLSTKEKQWFKEISLMVKNFNQSLKKNQSLNEQLKFIRKELTNVSTISGKNSDDYDWEELNSILVQGKRLLDSTQNSLSTNLKDLDTQLGALKV